jgi:hypothetical protein
MVDFEQLLSEGYVVNKEFVTNLDPEEQKSFLHYLKSEFFRPGEKVRVCLDTVDTAIALVRRHSGDTRMLESLKAADQKVLEIEKVYYKHERDICFKLTSSDVLFSSEYFIDSRPTLHMYGVILLIDDRLFALQLDGKEPAKVLNGFEIQGEVELGFGGVLGVSNREEFKHFLENEVDRKNSMCGEFYISDEGMETWCLSAKAWFTGASPQELEVATSYVETMLSAAPRPN